MSVISFPFVEALWQRQERDMFFFILGDRGGFFLTFKQPADMPCQCAEARISLDS